MTTDIIKDLSVAKIHITEQQNDLLSIICTAIFGECSTKIIEPGKKIDKFIDDYKVLILSSVSKENCTLAYKKHIQSKCSFYLLQYNDFNENNIDDEAVFRLTLYNLELFRIKSVRSKSKFLAKTSVDQINKEKYSRIINKNLIDKYPLFYLHLYRIIAFESTDSLDRLFCELNQCNKDEYSYFIDSILKLVFYVDTPISFCNTLCDYYINTIYAENVNKYNIFLILTKFYNKIDRVDFSKINSSPILDYCVSEDKNDEHLKMLDEFINALPLLQKNLHKILILIYAKILQNKNYERFFSKNIDNPSNKYEGIYCEILQKVEILLKQQKLRPFTSSELKRGVNEYLFFLINKLSPKHASPFFEVLVNQSLTE